MNTNFKKAVCAVLLLALIAAGVTGCSGRMTPKRLLSAVTENLAKAKSVSNSLHMNMEFEDVLDTMKISMDMQMENTIKPKAGHAKGTAQVDASGTKVGSDIEIYQVSEGRDSATYSSIYGKWSKETAKGGEKSGIGGSGNLFQEAGDSIKSFRIAKEGVTVEGKECYEMYGDISGKEFLDFMGLDIVKAFGLVNLPDEKAIKSLKIPITMDISKKEMLPARIIVDMTDVMNNLYDKYRKSTNVNDFTIKLEYTGFDQVQKIEVPEEVKAACVN